MARIKAEAPNIDLPDTRISDFLQRLSALFFVHLLSLLIQPAQKAQRPKRRGGFKLAGGFAETNIHKSGSACYWFGRRQQQPDGKAALYCCGEEREVG